MKRHKFKILSLFAVFAMSVAFACMSAVSAAAETTYAPSSIFATSGAATDGDQGYIAYKLSDGANVYYRKNLALKWFEGAGDAHYLGVTFSFGDTIAFESFDMKLESAQLSATKDKKTVNTLTFTVGADDALDVSVNGADAVDVPAGEEGAVSVSLAEGSAAGEFSVLVNGAAAGEFTNIGMYYSRYASSSADTPLTPITFHAELNEDAEEQLFVVREINGQSLALNDSGSVVDTEAPVLVINSEIKLMVLGSEPDFDYVAIDVLDSSVTTRRYYYAYDAEDPRVPLTAEDGESEDEEEAETTYETFESDKRFFDSDFPSLTNEEGLLSVAYRLTDGDNTAYYYIEWYAADGASAEAADGYSYLRFVKPDAVDTAPAYNFTDETLAEYEEAVENASKDGENDDRVGDGAYYYIPSLRPYIEDATCGYTDMTFDLYYRSEGADTQVSSGLDYDELSIELIYEGVYEFRVIPTNYLGNMLVGHDKDGKELQITVTNVWDIVEVPTFSFDVKYAGIYIEEPEEDAEDGYINVTYSFEDFEVIALNASYTAPVTEYKLYYLVSEGGDAPQADALKESLLSMGEDGKCEFGTWVEIAEDDEENEYAESWSESGRSFVPKTMGYFGIVLTARDGGLSTPEQKAAAVTNVTSRADTLPGETYWLRNNILSVVFICIGGVCLIGIIALLLIKPKEKKPAGETPADSAESELKEKRKNRK